MNPSRMLSVFNAANQGTSLVSLIVYTRERTDGNTCATPVITLNTVTKNVIPTGKIRLTKFKKLLGIRVILMRKWSLHLHLRSTPLQVKGLLGSQMLYWWIVERLLTSSITSPNSTGRYRAHTSGSWLWN